MTQDTEDVVARRAAIRDILYRLAPVEIDADICRAIADEFLALETSVRQSLSDRIDVLEAQRDLWRAEFKVLCDLVDQHKTRAALHQEHGSGE